MGGADNRGSEIDEEAFRGYIAAFNRNDFDGFGRFYADDIEFVGRAATLRGRDELLSFYQQVKSRVRETIAIQDIVAGERTLVADLITELYPLEDWPDFPTGPLRKGQTRRSQNFVWYDLADRRFIRIRAAHYRRVDGLTFEPTETPASHAAGTDRVTAQRGRTFTPEEFAAYIDAFNRGDFSRVCAYYDPEVVLVTGGHHELRGTAGDLRLLSKRQGSNSTNGACQERGQRARPNRGGARIGVFLRCKIYRTSRRVR